MTAPIAGVAELGTILSIWAHPDDETYLAAGVMAQAVDQGQRVVCVSATCGELGTGDPATWPPARLGPVRRWEAAAAMAVLGVQEHRFLGLPDGALDDHDAEGLALIGDLLDEIEPDTVLTFGPDGMTFHADHIAVHRWTTHAWEGRGRRARLLYAAPTVERIETFRDLYEEWGIYMTDERPLGVPADGADLCARLEGRDLDRKVTALRTMATQTADLFASLVAATCAQLVDEEAFVDAANVRPVTDRGVAPRAG